MQTSILVTTVNCGYLIADYSTKIYNFASLLQIEIITGNNCIQNKIFTQSIFNSQKNGYYLKV